MPAVTIRYRKTLSLALANNAINFTESSTVGHRVQIPMSVDYLNTFFVWQRSSGSPRPIGHFLSEVNSLKFIDVLISSLNKLYTDIDGSPGGLNYSSYILDSNYDSRVRCDGIGANDIIMAYILYKCYGTSAAPTMDIIYNLEDAQKMISSEQVASVIVDALNDDEQLALGDAVDKGGVDAMFRYILASNPLRYFKADGTQIDGLFETNFACGEADPRGQGSWGFMENDVIEMRLNFTFPKDVTHTTADDLGGNRTIVIPAGSNFGIRLQILATDTPGGASSKQAAAAAAEAAALGQQEAAAASSAANASIAAAIAEQQRQAAAYRTTIEEQAYARAVNENARQSIAASNAQARAAAALAALEEAIVSGSTEASIQNLRAAAIASSAAAARAVLISIQAATILQNAENAKAAAEQRLADAETAAAISAETSATANSITVAAALAKAQADAATIAATKAIEEATDPETKILTDAENKLLDLQTLTALRLSLSAANSKTLNAWTAFTQAKSASAINERKVSSARMDLNCAILANKSDGEINILQERLESALSAKVAAAQSVSLTTTALIFAQSNEKGALDEYTSTATQAATLAALVSKSALTYATDILNTASAALVTATTSNTTAQTNLTAAQTALSEAIAGGATMADVSVLRTAVVTKTAIAKTAATALSNATSAKVNAEAEVDSLTDAVASADAKVISVAFDNAALIESYNISLTSLETYEQSIITSVEVTTKARQLNDAHLRVVNAAQAADLANADYDVDKRQYYIASTAQVPDISFLSSLNSNVLEASAKKDATTAALALAQADYTTSYTGVIEDANSKEILDLAATNFTTSVANAKANALALALYDAIAASNETQIAFDRTQIEYTLAQNALNSAITATATIHEIRMLNNTLGLTRDAYLNATSAYNAAQAAVTVAQQGASISTESAAILTNVALLQRGQQMIEKANTIVADITAKYDDAASAQASLLSAKETYTIASAALVQAVKAGKNLTEIIPLQSALQKASIELTRLTYLTAGKNLALTNALTLGTQDSIAKAKIDSSKIVVQAATITAKINTLNAMLIKLNQEKFTAKTAFDIANEELVAAKLTLDSAITSGNSISDIQGLQVAVQTATNKVVLTQAAYTKAIAASTQASTDVNALTAEETSILASATKTPLTDAIATSTAASAAISLESKRTAADIMAASVMSQTITLRTSQSNLTAAIDSLALAQDKYDLAKEALDAAIAAGTDLDGLKDVLSAQQGTAATLANAQAVVASATKAYTNAQTAVASTQAIAAILESIALAAGV